MMKRLKIFCAARAAGVAHAAGGVRIASLFLVALAAGLVSCGEIDDGERNRESYSMIVGKFVSGTAVPSYKAVADNAIALRAACEELQAEPADETVEAMTGVWSALREKWELAEASLYGSEMERTLDIGSRVDSMRDVAADVARVLAQIEAGTLVLDGRVAWASEPGLKGFHVVEYLLFENGAPRSAAGITPAMMEYLATAADALVWDCISYYAVWVREESLTAAMQAALDENPDVMLRLEAFPQYMGYGARMAAAEGYPSWKAAMTDILRGASFAATAVGREGLEAPYISANPALVGGRFSGRTIDGLQNILLGVQNDYLGGTSDNSRSGMSLTACVKAGDSQFDTDIKDKITECLVRLRDIVREGEINENNTDWSSSDSDKAFADIVGQQAASERVAAAVAACVELGEMLIEAEKYIK